MAKRLSSPGLRRARRSAWCLPPTATPTNVLKGAKVPQFKTGTDSHVFYAGVKREGDDLVADSGRVLLVEVSADDIPSARKKVYEILDNADTAGMFYRHDIGAKALQA